MDQTKEINLPTGVTFIIIRPDGKVLMQLRDDGKGEVIPCPNMWAFPGGRMEPGETFIENAIREFKEEFAVTLAEKDLELLMIHSGTNFANDHVYIIRRGMDFDPPLLEGAALEWWPLEKIQATQLAFEHERIAAKLEAYLIKKTAR